MMNEENGETYFSCNSLQRQNKISKRITKFFKKQVKSYKFWCILFLIIVIIALILYIALKNETTNTILNTTTTSTIINTTTQNTSSTNISSTTTSTTTTMSTQNPTKPETTEQPWPTWRNAN